jgi:hypothetical protein
VNLAEAGKMHRRRGILGVSRRRPKGKGPEIGHFFDDRNCYLAFSTALDSEEASEKPVGTKITRERGSRAWKSRGKSCSNAFGFGNGCSDDDRVGAHFDCTPKILRTLNASLLDYRNRAFANQGCKQIPCRAYQPGACRRVSCERRRDGIGTGGYGLHCFPGSRDIGHHRQTELAADTPNQDRPGFSERRLPVCAIDRDDRCPGGGERAGRSEIRGDKDLPIMVALGEADDRFAGQSAKGANMLDSLGAQAIGPAAQNAGGDPGERRGVIQRVALGGLARDDQAVTQLFRKRQSKSRPQFIIFSDGRIASTITRSKPLSEIHCGIKNSRPADNSAMADPRPTLQSQSHS